MNGLDLVPKCCDNGLALGQVLEVLTDELADLLGGRALLVAAFELVLELLLGQTFQGAFDNPQPGCDAIRTRCHARSHKPVCARLPGPKWLRMILARKTPRRRMAARHQT